MQTTVTKRVARIEAHLTPKIVRGLEDAAVEIARCAAALDLPDVSNGPAVMASERSQASFNVRELTHLLDGGERGTQRKHAAYELVRNEPVFIDPGYYDRSRDEARYRVMQKLKRFAELVQKDPAQNYLLHNIVGIYDPAFYTRYGVHAYLFGGAIAGQGTDEMVAKYMDDVDNMRIVGVFGMTEMGHGSAIRDFETTATYNKAKDVIVINTPTITATKWWIGGAAHIATHTVVFGRLLVDGKDYGVHSYVVQVRDINGNLMPGVVIGDCGKKMGRDGIDNGWMQFNNVEVPRTNMLMKWAKLSPEGVYTKPPKAQLAYGALLKGRVGLIMNSAHNLEKALIIAIRYSVIRRQFASTSKGLETQILDYQTHQIRLLEPLAAAFAWHFVALRVDKDIRHLSKSLAQGELGNIADIHAALAGAKASCTWYVAEALEQIRQCLGGHGYSSYSGLPSLIADYAVNQTWEGDNTVMSLQTAQYLIKSLSQVMRGKTLTGSVQYLERTVAILGQAQWRATTEQDLSDASVLAEALERAAVKSVTRVAERLQREMQGGKSKAEAWDCCLIDLVQAASHHSYVYVLDAFVQSVEKARNKCKDSNVATILSKLLELFVLNRINKVSQIFLMDGFMNEKHVDLIEKKIRGLLLEIRKQAVPLTDAFDLPDFLVNSPLGKSDGEIYNAYMQTVKSAPGAMSKAPYWDELVKPCLRKDLA